MEKDIKKKPDYVINYFSGMLFGEDYRKEQVRRILEKLAKETNTQKG